MPADSVSPIPRDRGPAIQMDPLEHRQTSSWGRSAAAQAYRQQIKELIDAGRMRDAMAVEIKDVRRLFGTKYIPAIREMLDYAKNAGYLNK